MTNTTRVSTTLAAIVVTLATATGLAAEERRCLGMLGGAPEGIRQLEAVQGCRGADAGCSYLQLQPGYGVLTLICQRTGVLQVVWADRLSMLEIRGGAPI